MTIHEALAALSLYPVNATTAQAICDDCGLGDCDVEITDAVRTSDAFRRAKALVYAYLADAPDVTEAGVSYSLTDAQREQFRKKASAILVDLGETADGVTEIECGYISEDL